MQGTLNQITWVDFAVFLFYDLKLSRGKHGQGEYALKSRFLALQKYFEKVEFNRQTFTVFVADLDKRGISCSTTNKFIGLANHVFVYLKQPDELKGFKYFKEKIQETEPLTEKEMNQMVQIVLPYRKPVIQKRMSLLITLLSLYGCRINEALDLTFGDIYPDYLIFKETKNGDPRKCVLTEDIYLLIQALRETADPKEALFKNHYLSDISRDFKKRALGCGIKKRVYPHLFRHSVATILSRTCKDTKAVADFMGWRDINTAQRYIHINLEDQRQMLFNHHPFWQKKRTLAERTNALLAAARQIFADSGQLQLTQEENCLSLKVTNIEYLPDR